MADPAPFGYLQQQGASAKRERGPAPIAPALVIGLGSYGDEVARQLVARLLLTEAGLREQGLSGSLICRGSDEPGWVRVMRVNWDDWFQNDCTPDMLLEDAILAGPAAAERSTPPQRREEDLPQADVDDGLEKLKQSGAMEALRAAVHPLREHDLNMRVGHFQSLSEQQELTLQIFVVFAARDPFSAAFGPELVRILGEMFVKGDGICKGVVALCGIFGTSLSEHRQAGGSSDQHTAAWRDEYRRVVADEQEKSVVDALNHAWQKLPQTLDICYLIDSTFSNHQEATRGRLDEPDEVVLIAALALTMFITVPAQHAIRRATPRRWDTYGESDAEPGLFASLGVASYAIDHPKVRSYVFGRVVGDFLRRAQPPRKAERVTQGQPSLTADEGEDVPDAPYLPRSVEEAIRESVSRAIDSYAHDIDQTLARKRPASERVQFDYRVSVDMLEHCAPHPRKELDARVREATKSLVDNMRSEALNLRLVSQQNGYQSELEHLAFERRRALYSNELAPLIQSYRFTVRAGDVLKQRASLQDASLTRMGADQAKRQFAQDRQDAYERFVGDYVNELQTIILRRPTWMAALGRALMVIALAFVLVVPAPRMTLDAQSWLYQHAPVPVQEFSNFVTSLLNQPWLVSLANARWFQWLGWLASLGALWNVVFASHRLLYRRRLRTVLVAIVKRYQAVMADITREARRWALTEALLTQQDEIARVSTICMPRAILSQLRDRILAQELRSTESMLERLFINDELKRELEQFSEQLIEQGRLWNLRAELVGEILDTLPPDPPTISAMLRSRAEEEYRAYGDGITDIVSRFLEEQSAARLDEMWRDLSDAAVRSLRYDPYTQDDPTFSVEVFGVHDSQRLATVRELARKSGVDILASADRLRWIFMRVRAGIHLKGISFSMQAPSNQEGAGSAGSD